ncbi:MAG: phosphoenolpyruvate carboxylase [bacterium]|nr:phosphoenolpyruvate carboxylase [bacterium]
MNEYVLEKNFNEFVEQKFTFINSVFLRLPIDDDTGAARALIAFHDHVARCSKEKMNPFDIIHSFFKDSDDKNIINNLFQIIKYIERQVVLFDAIEDAAFEKINNLNGPNSLSYVINRAVSSDRKDLVSELLGKNRIRIVLTAHPTQFYPGTVLGIINDLNQAIRDNDLTSISRLLQQLAYTPFFNKEKPTPFDEALSLIWYLENVFYDAILNIHDIVKENHPGEFNIVENNSLIELGFWPGGDRDGNPFVTADTTMQVAHRLRWSVIEKYYDEVRKLKRKITFKETLDALKDIESALEKSISSVDEPLISRKDLISSLEEIAQPLKTKYAGLYLEDIERLIATIKIFKYHFAGLDIRQDNGTHHRVFSEIVESPESIPLELPAYIAAVSGKYKTLSNTSMEVIETIETIKKIQKLNGERGCNRYIISNCSSEKDIYELISLFHFSGWESDSLTVDIIPLFETITDLENAPEIMKALYSDAEYRAHVRMRNNQQTIMLGFSDGTKDGGYFTSNWSIYRAKEALTAISREFDVDVVFFDGRGGPAARGGGKTHNYYTSHGKSIENTRLQLTIQGQTVSSNFGTVMSAQYNMEQLISAGLKNRLYREFHRDFLPEDRVLMEKLSRESLKEYTDLKNHEKFTGYMVEKTAMPYYGLANIGSRPDRRDKKEEFSLKQLRAIPFVGSWNLNKQNIPGFYGLGSALGSIIQNNSLDEIKGLYERSLFFKTLMLNSMMVLKKTNFDITSHIAGDDTYGEFWNFLHDEYEKACESLLQVSGKDFLMQGNPKDRMSVEMREEIILPLCVIQQYALQRLDELKKDEDDSPVVEDLRHMVIRSSYGIINAGRNTA